MAENEKTYHRKSLGTDWSSSRLAYSYLEGRVSKSEVIVIDGENHTFSEIYLQDKIVQRILHEHGRPGTGELFPEPHELTFSERVSLYKTIVLRGDDTLGNYLAREIAQKNQIGQLQVMLQDTSIQLARCNRKNKILVNACQSVLPAILEVKEIAEVQRQHLEPQSETYDRYSSILTILGQVADRICTKLKNNLVPVVVTAELPDVETQKIEVIDDFRETSLKELSAQRKHLEVQLKNQREEADAKIQSELSELENRKNDEYAKIDQEREKAAQKLSKQQKDLTEWIRVKRAEFEEQCAALRADVQAEKGRWELQKKSEYEHIDDFRKGIEDELAKRKDELDSRELALRAECEKIRSEALLTAKTELQASFEKEQARQKAKIEKLTMQNVIFEHQIEELASLQKQFAEGQKSLLKLAEENASLKKQVEEYSAADAEKAQSDAQESLSQLAVQNTKLKKLLVLLLKRRIANLMKRVSDDAYRSYCSENQGESSTIKNKVVDKLKDVGTQVLKAKDTAISYINRWIEGK